MAALSMLMVLAVMVPLAVAVGSRAMPAPRHVEPLTLSSSKDLMIHRPGASFPARSCVSGVSGFVCSDWAHWGPVARITCTDDGFHIAPSRWPVVGRRIVPDLMVRWNQVDALEAIPGERGADILVVKIRDPRIAFGLWLGHLNSRRLASEFDRMVSEAKGSRH